MKKKAALLLSLLLMLSALLIGCSKENVSGPKEEGKKPDKGNAVIDNSWQDEEITLKIASFEDADLVDEMLKAFMEKYPNVTVERDEAIVWPWTDSLANAASAGNLPDVFSVEMVPVGVENDWLLDVTNYFDVDPDSENVYPNLAKTAVYHGKRMAVPSAQALMGVFVNKTLFEQNNVELPSYDWNYDQMIELARELSNPSEHYYGIGGPWGDLAFESYLPMQDDSNISYNMWDGEKFNFNHEAWIEGYNKKAELIRLKVDEKMTGEEKIAEFGDEGAWPALLGHTAMFVDGSWNATWLPGQMEESGAGEVDFYPYPGGKAGQRIPVVLDYMGVSSTTKHPEAAFELLKFMTFGKDGWLAKVDLIQELDKDVSHYPVANYPEVWEKIEGLVHMEGAKANLKLLDNAVPDFNKWLPGWGDFVAWMNEEEIYAKMNNGELSPADMAQEIEDKANQFVQEAFENLK